jgi:asparagine synthase (glutamine-hydrolysing)
MSAQFGRWNFDRELVSEDYLERVRSMIAPYGPDGGGCYKKENVGILYQAFHTTKESRLEVQPCILRSGTVLTWDGRLDNRADLMSHLSNGLLSDSPDATIIAAAYEQWGVACFAKLIGDWALSAWNPADQSLILAKDFLGTRHLYYSLKKDQVTWSTILDPLVLLAGHPFDLQEEYVAGWLSFFPAAHITPYVGIQSVPPSGFVRIANGKLRITKYWDFDPSHRIHYRSDGEYEEHFRTVFARSVEHRLRSDKPVLAELSGGMDSSSIVCMADMIIDQGRAATPRLDTVSYYDDSEPNWNERPYFTKVEQKRGRVGCHIDVSADNLFSPKYDRACFAPLPGSYSNPSEDATPFAACLDSQGNRVLLSGIGGDEVLGGVPTETPELADLAVTMQLGTLARQMLAWALVKRRPVLHLAADMGYAFLPTIFQSLPQQERPPAWVMPKFASRHRLALRGYPGRLHFFDALPSFCHNLRTLDALRRQLTTSVLSLRPLYEKRYPYLDRDLLEYLYAIPRGQLLNPRQRRSLMRRSLIGLVPEELLNRKRKAFVAHGLAMTVNSAHCRLADLVQRMVSSSLGILDPGVFAQELNKVRSGLDVQIVPIIRTVQIEFWLRHQIHQGAITDGRCRLRSSYFVPERTIHI